MTDGAPKDDARDPRGPLAAIGAGALVLAWAFFRADLDGPLAVIAGVLLLGALAVGFGAPRADVRSDGAAALALASVAVAGQIRDRTGYAIAAAFAAIVCFVVVRRARAPEGASRPRLATLGVLAAGAPITAALVFGLPPLSRRIEGRIAEYLASAPISNSTGFAGDDMPMGSTVGLLLDDAIVLRVRGAPTDLLRGAVYETYTPRGGWHSALRDEAVVEAARIEDPTTIVVGGNEGRFFVPHDHRCVRTENGRARVTSGGVFLPSLGEASRRVESSRAGCTGPQPAPPTPADLDVPKALTPLLDATLDRWGVRANRGVRAQVDAIQAGLAREHSYKIEVSRDPRVDPVVDFLTKNPEGHCELFASSAALLARRAGIPARVVAGYRVLEPSRFGGWFVVRKSHAHAWIETWDGHAWVTLDPTPSRDGPMGRRGGFLASARELVGAAYDELRARVSNTELTVGLSLVALGIILGREIRTRLRERTRARRRAVGDALPAFLELTAALARRGVVRAPGEPVEAFARRVAREEGEWAPRCRDAIVAYAALRYGGDGAEDEISRALRDTAASL